MVGLDLLAETLNLAGRLSQLRDLKLSGHYSEAGGMAGSVARALLQRGACPHLVTLDLSFCEPTRGPAESHLP